ncbi:TPA: hypothetical protein NJY08_005048 [Salmonella enterica subsp. enterica serovar Typhi str. AG3]|nr:hypothetical protein [Salmonella enterica subsp. enterica serovar Typhi str. AG3]
MFFNLFIALSIFFILLLLLYFKVSLISGTIVFALYYIIVKMIPSPSVERFEVFFDRFIFNSKVKNVELDFNSIAFIDQDVIGDGKNAIYKSIEFLNGKMESLLFIDARGYNYIDLVVLCNRIREVNEFYSMQIKEPAEVFNIEGRELIDWEDFR